MANIFLNHMNKSKMEHILAVLCEDIVRIVKDYAIEEPSHPLLYYSLELVDYCDAASDAASIGDLRNIKKLHKIKSSNFDCRTLTIAATDGNLEMVQWLCENQSICSTNAVDGAARNNHLAVVKYLVEQMGLQGTTDTMDSAARNGHSTMVKWLDRYTTMGCTRKAIDWAARCGDLRMIRWLHRHRKEGGSIEAMRRDILRWLCETRGTGYV